VRQYRSSPEPAEEDLTRQLSRAPDDRELAARLNVSVSEVLEARRAHRVFTAHSLDAPLSGEHDPGLLAGLLGEDDPGLAHAPWPTSATSSPPTR
jgi:DNA-directed RNA polymerase specialized sigma subunit